MNSNKLTVIPPLLQAIASPPKVLFHAGTPLEDLLSQPRLAIVGSRQASTYGQAITDRLASQLAEQGVLIISGLALGVDSIAHEAALAAGGLTLAVLPGPIEKVTPASHRRLAERIVAAGGALVSEYALPVYAAKQNFVARNRLVAGLAQAVLITEAAEHSGSLHTARFAEQQGKPVLAVPGNVTSPGSAGTNQLLQAGAQLVTSYQDVLKALSIQPRETVAAYPRGRDRREQSVLDSLAQGITESNELLKNSELTAAEFNQVLTMLEIAGKIRRLDTNRWTFG